MVGSPSSRPFPVSLLVNNLSPCASVLSVAGLQAVYARVLLPGYSRFTVGHGSSRPFPVSLLVVHPRPCALSLLNVVNSGIQERTKVSQINKPEMLET